MFNKILVPLDGSEFAELALEPALTIARQGGGEIILLSVPVYGQIMVPSTAGYGLMLPEQALDSVRDKARHYLEQVQQEWDQPELGQPDLTIRSLVLDGDVAGNIVDVAAQEEVDLIVMTTHGYSGVTRWVLGSIAERVLRGAICPVLVVRHAGSLENVLITMDGSKLAEQALEPGLLIACMLAGRVTLLQVDTGERLSDAELDLMDLTGGGLGTHITTEMGGRAKYYLEGVAQSCRQDRELEVSTVVVTGSPAEAILEYAESQEIDLIAMASHGRTGVRRWVYGSVTEKVLRKAGCGMLIVRPGEERE